MNLSPIEIIHLFAYEGPNICGPQPGVLLRAACDKDRSRRIKEALKDGAQSIGLIAAYLDVSAAVAGAGYVVTASFTTPQPQIGAALAAYVVAGVRAKALNDEEWDADGPLYELRKQRRAATPPVAVLQLIAEARARGRPVLTFADGRVRLGYGARGWSFAQPAAPQQPAPTPPWERIGAIPIYAVTGERDRGAWVERVAAELRAAGSAPHTLDDADTAATRALLADPSVESAVIGLRTTGILRHGLAFDRCTQAIITDMAGARPAEAASDEEWARALGVPMLIAEQPARLAGADQRLAALAAYAPHGVIPLT